MILQPFCETKVEIETTAFRCVSKEQSPIATASGLEFQSPPTSGSSWTKFAAVGAISSQSDLCLHFGVGGVERIDEVKVRWPSGKVDSLKDLAANQRLFVQEGKGLIRAILLPN